MVYKDYLMITNGEPVLILVVTVLVVIAIFVVCFLVASALLLSGHPLEMRHHSEASVHQTDALDLQGSTVNINQQPW